MTNYLGEESDVDEYYQLEQQIYNKPKEQVAKFAEMVKSHVSDNGGDLFGDLDMGLLQSDYKYDDAKPEVQESVVEPMAQTTSSINVADSIVDVPQQAANDTDYEPYSQTIQKKQYVNIPTELRQQKSQIPQFEDELYSEPVQKPSILKNAQAFLQQAPKISPQQQQQPNVVRMPAAIKNQIQEAVPEQTRQILQPGQPVNYDEQMEYQLKSLEKEIQRQAQKNQEYEDLKRKLILDISDEKRQLEQERQDFAAAKKAELAEIKRQKQYYDDQRQQKQAKQSQLKELEAKIAELEKQNISLQQEKAKAAATYKAQLEALRGKYDAQIAENADIKAKITEQDKIMLQMRKQEQKSARKLEKQTAEHLELQRKFAHLEDQFLQGSYAHANARADAQPVVDLSKKEERTPASLQQVNQLKIEQMKRESAKQKPEVKQLYSAEKQQQQQPRPAQVLYKAGQPAQQQQQQQVAAPKQQEQRLVPKVPAYQTTKQLMKEPEFGREIAPTFDASGEVDWRNELPGLPYYLPEELFDQFNADLEYYVLNSQVIGAEMKGDKEEQSFDSGARLVKMGNGTTKLVLPDGSCNIRFQTGDMKRIQGPAKSQQIVYFYNEAGTLFTQINGGEGALKIYRFDNGQFEKHLEDGRKVVYYPDGTVKYIYGDGTEKAVFADGSVEVFRK